MSRTLVPRWAPPFRTALRLAVRPALAYLAFAGFGFVAFVTVIVTYEKEGKDLPEILFACGAGMLGLVLGQVVAIARARLVPVFVVGGVSAMAATYILVTGSSSTFLPSWLAPAVAFFCFAFPCGMLSLQHRWDLVASFWPSVGWIGSVFLILNHENRVDEWEADKVSIWLPLPLVLLGGFLIFWVLYLAAKQAMRIELWQALSGAAERRVVKNAAVSALPRRNLGALVAVAVLLFAVVALLAPYLWRTGKGDREGVETKPDTEQVEPSPKAPDIDGERVVQMLMAMARAAKNAGAMLWPLLLLPLLWRPTKRLFLTTHLVTPILPTPPSERIENLWEYVRINAEDAGVVPEASDSVDELMTRIRERGLMSPAIVECAAIYMRTRYGFTVQPGDAESMRGHARVAGRALRARQSVFGRVRSAFRGLS